MPGVNLAECIRNKTMSLVDMKAFKCHKTVHAMPMNHRDYCSTDPFSLRTGVNQDGYLVCYDMGTSKEYVSWSPKEQFDNGYSVTDTHIERMQLEHRNLQRDIAALSSFINQNPVFKNLCFEEKELVRKQRTVMSDHLIILGKRIALANNSN